MKYNSFISTNKSQLNKENSFDKPNQMIFNYKDQLSNRGGVPQMSISDVHANSKSRNTKEQLHGKGSIYSSDKTPSNKGTFNQKIMMTANHIGTHVANNSAQSIIKIFIKL
jgi:hypothetical protein